MKTLLVLVVLISTLFGGPAARAQMLLGSAIGAAAGSLLTSDKSVGTQVAVASGLALVGGYVGKKMEDKKAQTDFRNMQIGRWQETWIRANTDWYASTMDRRSGLPPAFDGYWAMYSGLPVQEREFVQRRLGMPDQFVPSDREEYLQYLGLRTQAATSAAANAQSDVVVVPASTARMPKRSVNGVEYRPRMREFPRLP